MDQTGARIFSVDEANRLIPFLEQSLETLAGMSHDLTALRRDVEVLAAIAGSGASNRSPDVRELREKQRRHQEIVNEFKVLLAGIARHGCILRDLEIGLVDFYANAGDRIVCLCWRRGEPQIGHWHPIDQGFSGRRPLSELS